jgi:tRNA uridine 5-carboxymethylaminomethyl modification enzyme
MFTSRAEYRLLLREDNADLRLAEKGYRLGLLDEAQFRGLEKKKAEIGRCLSEIENHFFHPTHPVAQAWLSERGIPPLKDRVSAGVFLRRPEVNWTALCDLGFPGADVEKSVQEQVEIHVKYDGYIKRDLDLMEGVRKSDSFRIPDGLNFEEVPGLSTEVRGRLKDARPETIGQASRMSGITPAAVANLMIFLKMKGARDRSVRP